MAFRKIHIAIAFILLAASALAQAVEWQTVTSLRNVRMFGEYGGHLFVATSGGMLEITDVAEPGAVYDNIEGFGTTDLWDFLVDQSGELWTVGNGHISRGIGASMQQYLIRDNDGNLIELRAIADDNDHLWIGTDRGLILFSKSVDGGQILDSYALFGNLNPAPTINEVMLDGTSIWLATSDGLATADRSNPILLKAPANWTSFNVADYPELTTENINRVARFAGDTYVATDGGVFRLEINTGLGDTSFVALAIGNNISYADFVIQNDTMFCYYDDDVGGGIAAFDGLQITSLPTTGLPRTPLTGFAYGGARWVAVEGGGIYHNMSGNYAAYPYVGTPGNNVTGVVVNDTGTIYAGFGRDASAFADGDTWTTIPFFVRGGVNDVSIDTSGAVYFATEGNGWWRYLNGQLTVFDHRNTTLRGTGTDPFSQAFVVVRGAAFDDGWVFLLVREPYNDYPVAYTRETDIDVASSWDSLGSPQGFTDKFISSIDFYQNQLAVATDASGIYYCEFLDSPDNKQAIRTTHYEEGFESNLLSNTVRVVRFDNNGVLWAGTNFGLNRYEFFEEGFVPITLPPGIGPDIRDIEFDKRGNAWVGCTNGLARIDATTGVATGYTTLNSDLVGNAINDIYYDRFSGRVFVATENGLSIIPSEIGTPTSRLDSVVAFPNPFVITSGSERLQFTYLENGRISIHSVAGELIDELFVNDGWDGRNAAGEPVVSGVYIWVLTDEGGEIARGKILLVRK